MPAMAQTIIDYQSILKSELARRMAVNPKYSLRAFSKDLEISPSKLSELLNYRQGLSMDSAKKIAHRMGLSPSESKYFCKLVEGADSRSKKNRVKAIAYLKKKNAKPFLLSDAHSECFSSWIPLSLRELTLTKNFLWDESFISKRLGISVAEANYFMEQLLQCGLIIKKSQGVQRAVQSTTTSKDIPSETIRRYHRSTLKKAQEALELQNIWERDFSSLTLAIPTKDVPKFKKKIAQFRKTLDTWSEWNIKKNSPDEVYCISIQFFKMTKKMEGTK
jgi:uncharacterized protein (TIGR02147 family)